MPTEVHDAPAKQPKNAAPMPPLTPQQSTVEERGEIAIEIVPRIAGSTLVCDPMRGIGIDPPILRGRWSRERMPSGLTAGESGLDNLPAVPGQCVSIHLGRMYVRIFDPLNDPRNRDRMAMFNAVWLRSPYSQGISFAPVPDRVVNLRRHTDQQTCDNAATWLYWIQRQIGMWNRKQRTAELVPNSASPNVPFPQIGEYVGDPTINFDATAAPGEPRTFSQMIARFEFLGKQGTLKTVVE